MSNDALANWLARYQRPAALEGPSRGTHLREPLEPGDVREDGTITTPSGYWARFGPIWVTERQCWAACYYGWQVEYDQHGPMVTELDDVPLYLISRRREDGL